MLSVPDRWFPTFIDTNTRLLMKQNYSDVIEKLKKEGTTPVSDQVLLKFLESAQEITLKRNQAIVDEGEINSDIHIVREGVIRYCYQRKGRDITAYFAMPATPVCSYHSFCMNSPSFYRLEACTKAKVLRIKKEDFLDMIRKSREFALWVIDILQCQLYFLEYKDKVITGNAADRLVSLFKNRPELLRAVSSKVIASYLGITESYLSRLKRKLFEEDRF